MRRGSGVLGIGTTEIMSQFLRKGVNLKTFWTLPLHLALHLDLQESFSCKNCEHFVKISLIVKGATSRITQLEKAGKFFQVCHS